LLNIPRHKNIEFYDAVYNEIDKNKSFLGIKILDKKQKVENYIVKFSKSNRKFLLNAYDYTLQKQINRENLFFKTFYNNQFPLKIPIFIKCFENNILWKSCLVTEKIDKKYKHVPFTYKSTIEEAKFCIKELAKLHSQFNNTKISWLQNDKNSDILSGIYLYQYKYDLRFIKLINILSNYLNTLSQTIIHGDYRVGNILFNKNNEDNKIIDVVVLDWQTIMMNNGIYDLVYFLCMSLDTTEREENEKDLILYYLEHLEYEIKDYQDIYVIMQLVMVCLYFHYNIINYYENWGCSSTDANLWTNRFLDICKNIDVNKINNILQCDVDLNFIKNYLISGYV
jgi:serine/threonine protein kinase